MISLTLPNAGFGFSVKRLKGLERPDLDAGVIHVDTMKIASEKHTSLCLTLSTASSLIVLEICIMLLHGGQGKKSLAHTCVKNESE